MRILHLLVSMLCIVLILTFFCFWYFSSHVFPNTYIGSLPISFMETSRVEALFSSPSSMYATIKLHDRMYVLSYDSLGIFVSEKDTLSELFSVQKKPITFFFQELISSFFQIRRILPSFEYSYIFSTFVKTPPAMMKKDDIFIVDENGVDISNFSEEVNFQIHRDDFIEKLKRSFGNPEAIVEPLLIPTRSEKEQKADIFNTSIKRMTTMPITLFVKEIPSGSADITIPPSVITSFVSVSLDKQTNTPFYTIKRDAIEKYLTDQYQKESILPSLNVTPADVSYDVLDALHDRFQGGTMTTLYAKTRDVPHSDGTLSPKYIEIDLENQRMYLFQNKSVVKKYRISSGKDFPTPPGTYKILNKALNAYSGKYHVYMPYWMAFYYHPTLRAYFGIHELPYFLKQGEKVWRPRENIGAPNTGGCVALDIGQAKEVYEFSDIGMPVYIFE